MAVTQGQRETYQHFRDKGLTQAAAAKKAGFSAQTAWRLENRNSEGIRGKVLQDTKAYDRFPGPIPYDKLANEPMRALWDFTYFQSRYFGRIPSPWQEESAHKIIDLLSTDEEEYLVINCPPGSGKTLAMCHDIIAWAIVRNRSIRVLIGSITRELAARNVGRLKRSFERVTPEKAKPDDLRRGWAVDAVATLSEEFGRFKPVDRDLWTRENFVVMQHGDATISEKEPTVSSYGMDTAFIGGRYDLVVWDDLVDPKKLATREAREALEDMWTDVGETRLEPGGLCVLQGQRIAANDLYRYALDMVAPTDDEEEEEEEEGNLWRSEAHMGERLGKKYHHIKFQAHYDELCDGTQHSRRADPYPNGCLLVPHRITWRKVRTWQENKAERFAVLYQQEDIDPEEVLVPAAWVWGTDGFPGCIDKDRGDWEIPQGLDLRDCLFVATADPSPTNYWSIQAWLYHPESQMRYLIALMNKKMDAPDFLDWSVAEGEFVGVMEDWQQRSMALGLPISTWVVEQNAAQRFLLQYDHVKRWRAAHSVDIIPHTTSRNKSDPEFGLQAMRPHWRYGRVRLPGREPARTRMSLRLIGEVTRYPHGGTDDNVMAQWFFEWQLPNIVVPKRTSVGAWRPSWMKAKVA